LLEGLLQGGFSFPDFEVEQDFPTVGRRSLVLGGCRINHLKMILLAFPKSGPVGAHRSANRQE